MTKLIDVNSFNRRVRSITEAWRRQNREYEALLLESVVEEIISTEPDASSASKNRAKPREYCCPYCHHAWMEDRDASDYPNYCPGCGDQITVHSAGIK